MCILQTMVVTIRFILTAVQSLSMRVNGATEAGTFVKVRVEAPYTEITKAEIVARGAVVGNRLF